MIEGREEGDSEGSESEGRERVKEERGARGKGEVRVREGRGERLKADFN